MNFLKGIILVLIFFTAPYLMGNDFNAKVTHNHTNIITTKDIKTKIKKENANKSFLINFNNSLQLNAVRNNKDNGLTNTSINCKNEKQFQNIIKYIYTKSFLENKSELALLQLKFQKQPNAP